MSRTDKSDRSESAAKTVGEALDAAKDGVSTPREPEPDGSLRETMESIVIAFVLAFAFRAFVVEAFVIPTGSMAPTLLGEHVPMSCPQCGYAFTMTPADSVNYTVDCPQCTYSLVVPSYGTKPYTQTGDRILVLKFLYAFRDPRRWEVVVFKNPTKPGENYIKRLIGLPNEELAILSGNIYTRPLDAAGRADGDRPWRIQRKPDSVQRALWQPIYHSNYRPLDGGVSGQRDRAWSEPWQPVGAAARQWERDAHAPRWTFNAASPEDTGTMRFMFTELTANNYYAYNSLTSPHGDGAEGDAPVEDMRLGVTVQPTETPTRLTLDLSGRGMLMRAVIEPDGGVVLQTAPLRSTAHLSATLAWQTRVAGSLGAPLAVGRGTRVELWHADQALSLWVAGRPVVRWAYSLADLGMTLRDVHEPNRHGPIVAQFSVQGGPATVRAANLDRDLYYTQEIGDYGSRDNHARIGPDQFYCLGDNSPWSSDSRRWKNIDESVVEMLNMTSQQAHRDVLGRVPRELMIGRAFFVYWPAWHDWAVPSFGKMRFIR